MGEEREVEGYDKGGTSSGAMQAALASLEAATLPAGLASSSTAHTSSPASLANQPLACVGGGCRHCGDGAEAGRVSCHRGH